MLTKYELKMPKAVYSGENALEQIGAILAQNQVKRLAVFTDKGIEITFHPGKEDEEKLTPVGYGEILKLGEDLNFLYLFPTPNGGYCIPKTKLGEKQKDFVKFVEWKTGKKFYRRRPSPLQRIRDWLRERNSEPEHL